jgi:hypothetical protein
MNVLVACEESQRVCTAFRERGHTAWSCDIIPCSGGHPEWHILGDCLPLLNGDCEFTTEAGGRHEQKGQWDLIIAHPPCTYLSAASAVRLFDKNHNIKDLDRYMKMQEAARFFKKILRADCDRIAVENPVPLRVAGLPGYSQMIEPYFFGDPWKKRTCLWLRGLPMLYPTDMVEPEGYWIGAHGHDKAKKGMSKGYRDQKTRSKTFPGIARAMAEQWGADGGTYQISMEV